MKFAAIPALALLPAAAVAGAVEKRAGAGLSCSTQLGAPNGNPVLTKTVTVKANKVAATIRVRRTVTVTPTVTRRISGTVTVTERVTATVTLPPRTHTITDPTTTTVATVNGFIPAVSAMANAQAKRDALLAARAPAKVAVAVACTVTAADKAAVQAKVTVAVKPDITQYARAHTVTRGKQSTLTRTRTVAVVTTQRTRTTHVAKATAYAACGASNLLGWTFGQSSGNGTTNGTTSSATAHVGINSVALVVGTVARQFDAASAVQCCSACQANPQCVGSQWRSGVCAVHLSASLTCPRSAFSFGSFYANPNSPLQVNEGLIVSNGQCGATWKFGGFSGN